MTHELFENKLKEIFAQQHKLMPQSMLEQFDSIVDTLISIDEKFMQDFLESPAAAKYHQNYEGGLLEHSLKMIYWLYTRMIPNAYQDNAIKLSYSEVILIGLCHDFCKVNLYIKQEDGSYAYRKDQIKHHAKLSLDILEKLCGKQSSSIRVCILLHMAGGFYNSEDIFALTEEDDKWLKENLRTVFAVQWADMKACEII